MSALRDIPPGATVRYVDERRHQWHYARFIGLASRGRRAIVQIGGRVRTLPVERVHEQHGKDGAS